MATVTHYARPSTVDEALRLLERPAAVAIGGGTHVNATPSAPIEIVDLQSLGLDQITRVDTTLHIGATTTLAELMDAAGAPPVVRDAARREQPSTLRTQATVGGTIALCDRESELVATLLAHDARVTLVDTAGFTEVALETLLATLPLPRGRIVASVTIATDGRSFAERTGSTRADRPIVAVVGRTVPGREPRLAADPESQRPRSSCRPARISTRPADFRGSAEYRRALAETLVARVLERLA